MKIDEFINRVSRTVDDRLMSANPADLPPNVVGRVLSDIGNLLQTLALSYDDNSLGSTCADYRKKFTFLHSLLRELGDNFFPMAHTEQRLEKLRIITVDEIIELHQVRYDLLGISADVLNHHRSYLDEYQSYLSHHLKEIEERLKSFDRY